MSTVLIYWSMQMNAALSRAEKIGPYVALIPSDLVKYYQARAEWRKAGGSMNLYPKGGPVCRP